MPNIYLGNITLIISGKSLPGEAENLSFSDFLEYDIRNFLKEAEKAEKPGTIAITDADPNTILDYFIEKLVYIEAAGGLVQNPDDEILFIFRRGKWDLPKGKPDSGETSEETARREVEEETGVSGLNIISHLQSTWHIYELANQEYALKRSIWFQMTAHYWKEIRIQTEEDITEAAWIKMPVPENILDNAYPSIQELVRNFQLQR
jgi:8-oxo-dGTP pyrophosphatase MutT (NUDIX family)